MSDYRPLLTVDALQALLPSQPLLLDCRFELADPAAGRRAYLQGHVPGALHADLDQHLSDLSRVSWGLGRHPLPSAAAWSQTLAAWGWTPERWLIAYDAAGGVMAAARLWWLARLAGIERVAVLDGGLAAWTAQGGALQQAEPSAQPSAVQLSYRASAQATAEELINGVAAGSTVLLDARPAQRFQGEGETIDPVAGHVPGALNRPYALNLQADGRFKSADLLRQEYQALLGAHKPAQLVHMCGSGVSACHNLLAMEHAGLSGSRLYPPSWSGWISEPGRKVATGR